MGEDRAERAVEVEATREACWAQLVAFETYPDWQPAVRTAVVHERDAEGRSALVEFTADAVVREIAYTARYHFDAPGRMWWELVSGTVKSGGGEFVLEELAPRRTRATYRLDVDLGFYVPGPLKRKGTEVLMGGVTKGLKQRVEQG